MDRHETKGVAQQPEADIDLEKESFGFGRFIKNAADSMLARHESGLDNALTKHNEALARARKGIANKGKQLMSGLNSAVDNTAAKVADTFNTVTSEIAAEAGFGVDTVRGLSDYKRAYKKASQAIEDIGASEAVTGKAHEALQQVAQNLENGLAEQVAQNTDVSTRRSDVRSEISTLIDTSVSKTYTLVEAVRSGKFDEPQAQAIEQQDEPQSLPEESAQQQEQPQPITLASVAKKQGVTDEIRESIAGDTQVQEPVAEVKAATEPSEQQDLNTKTEKPQPASKSIESEKPETAPTLHVVPEPVSAAVATEATPTSSEDIRNLSVSARARLTSDIEDLSQTALRKLFNGKAMGANESLKLVGSSRKNKSELLQALKDSPERLAFAVDHLGLEVGELPDETETTVAYAAAGKSDGGATAVIRQ